MLWREATGELVFQSRTLLMGATTVESCSDWAIPLTRLRREHHAVRFLCGRLEWEQGDFFDDAGLGSSSGFGTDSGLVSGRHVRYNYDNYTEVRRYSIAILQTCAMQIYLSHSLKGRTYRARTVTLGSLAASMAAHDLNQPTVSRNKETRRVGRAGRKRCFLCVFTLWPSEPSSSNDDDPGHRKGGWHIGRAYH